MCIHFINCHSIVKLSKCFFFLCSICFKPISENVNSNYNTIYSNIWRYVLAKNDTGAIFYLFIFLLLIFLSPTAIVDISKWSITQPDMKEFTLVKTRFHANSVERHDIGIFVKPKVPYFVRAFKRKALPLYHRRKV